MQRKIDPDTVESKRVYHLQMHCNITKDLGDAMCASIAYCSISERELSNGI